jgi:hypothetical protein
MPEETDPKNLPIIRAVKCCECEKLIAADGRFLVVECFSGVVHVGAEGSAYDREHAPKAIWTVTHIFCDNTCLSKSIAHLH